MRTRAVGLATILAVAACSSTPRARTGTGTPVLTVHGGVVGGAARFGAPDVAQLHRRSFRAMDPRGGAEATYEGIALSRLLGEGLELDKAVDVVVVHGEDGYQVPIPLSVVRQLGPVLADRVNGTPLAEARPDAAPFALVWPTRDAPGLAHDPRARWWWVDGVKRLEVISWGTTYGVALRVPTGAADEARPGADGFETSCINCHRVRGVGGSRGPELTTKLKDPVAHERFAGLVRNHAARRDAAAIAALPAPSVRQIGAFLRAVALAGPPLPGEEPPVERRDEPPRQTAAPGPPYAW
jgi:hypothetical protein